MAVRFFNGSSYLSNLAFRPASFPVTISAWIRPEVLGAGSYQHAVTLMDSTSNTISSILINYPNSGNVSNQVYNGGTNALPYNTGLVANTWHHVIVISTSSSCTVYLNGVQGTIATYGTTTYSNPLDRLHFGYIPSTQYYYGSIAQVGVWNTVLSADDIKALSNAYSPDMVCRNNLIAYYPLGGNYSDYKKERWKDKYDLTLTGTIQEIDHPRVIYKKSVDILKPSIRTPSVTLLYIPALNFALPTTSEAYFSTRNSIPIVVFDGTSSTSCLATVDMPTTYSGGECILTLHVVTESATSGNISFDVSIEKIGDRSLDLDSNNYSSTKKRYFNEIFSSGLVYTIKVPFTFSNMGSISAGETFSIKITRNTDNDNITTNVGLLGVEIGEV